VREGTLLPVKEKAADPNRLKTHASHILIFRLAKLKSERNFRGLSSGIPTNAKEKYRIALSGTRDKNA
jgi:hypothetical protein